jgi:hypothetical protein
MDTDCVTDTLLFVFSDANQPTLSKYQMSNYLSKYEQIILVQVWTNYTSPNMNKLYLSKYEETKKKTKPKKKHEVGINWVTITHQVGINWVTIKQG